MSVDEAIAAIDAAVGCQQCGRPLDGSVSDDFHDEECQTAWHAARASRPAPLEPGVGIMRDESIARAYEQLIAFIARQRGMREPND